MSPRLTILSGGQTGVDRAALDAAMAAGIPVAGWCPKGRRAEDGCIPNWYPLRETPSPEYHERTRWNVRDSAATVVLILGALQGGALLTVEVAKELNKPLQIVDLGGTDACQKIKATLKEFSKSSVINMAGPRESERPGIYAIARQALSQAFIVLEYSK